MLPGFFSTARKTPLPPTTAIRAPERTCATSRPALRTSVYVPTPTWQPHPRGRVASHERVDRSHDGCVASCNPTLFVTRCCNHTYPSWPVDARDARGTGSPGTNETTRGRTTALDRVTTDATVCSALLVHHPLWFDNQFWGRTREMCELCLKGGHLGTRF